MNKKTVACSKCGTNVDTYRWLAIATCPKCGKVVRYPTRPAKDDPRRQKPQQPGDQKPL